jgi:hypothetical protein
MYPANRTTSESSNSSLWQLHKKEEPATPEEQTEFNDIVQRTSKQGNCPLNSQGAAFGEAFLM